jgi:hypothetical protein
LSIVQNEFTPFASAHHAQDDVPLEPDIYAIHASQHGTVAFSISLLMEDRYFLATKEAKVENNRDVGWVVNKSVSPNEGNTLSSMFEQFQLKKCAAFFA